MAGELARSHVNHGADLIVVLGGESQRAAASLRPARAEIAYNESYGTGCASSLLAGLDAVVIPEPPLREGVGADTDHR